ncbi:hypothetical protein O3M35_004649 [Rhynocoris fuscipes]|uniref:Uncharacterized protein n=1 Tax=Rhynocoris fuscipes TaxID=488301 RepID=A0AAW1CG49_9HEMI
MDSSTKIKRKQSKTIRLTVDLSNTDEYGCAVFNYRDLVKAEMEKRKREKRTQQNANKDSDDDCMRNEDEALNRIALQYEEKYGSNNMRYQSYSELGAGYDENDSFIDNTEACEEILPEDIEPIRGGYYVNCGELEFKTLDGQYEGNKTGRKRITEADLDEDETNTDAKKAKVELKDKNEDNDNKVSNGKLSKRITPKSLSKLNMIAEQVESHDKISEVDVKSDNLITSNQKNNDIVGDERNEAINCNEINESDPDNSDNDSSDTNVFSNSETSNSTDVHTAVKEQPASLPQNLSSEIIGYINELKSRALNFGLQRKFLSDSSNAELLKSLETKCRMELDNSSRQHVYEYLSNYLPYTKATLMSKARKIFIGADQFEYLLTKISSIIKRCDSKKKLLRESKEYMEKVIKIKVREYIVKRSTKKISFDCYLNEFFNELTKLSYHGCLSVSILKDFHKDLIKRETEAFKINYSINTLPIDSSTQNQFVDVISNENNEQNQGTSLNTILPSTSSYNNDYPVSSSKDVTSADDKLQMQVDQVLQDLVVLSQMSSDTSPNAKF